MDVLKFKIPRRHIIFFVLLFLTSVTLLITDMDCYPVFYTLQRVKYIYIIVVFMMLASKWSNGKIKKSQAYTVLAVLLAHTLLFGYVFVNSIVLSATLSHAKNMLIYISMVFVTYAYIREFDVFKEFIIICFFASAVQLALAAVTHLYEFGNPIWGIIQTFKAVGRTNATFGFTHQGLTSNACFLYFVFALFFWNIVKKENLSKWFKLLIILGDIAVGLMLIGAAERSGIIGVFLTYAGYLFFKYYSRPFKYKKIVTIWLIVLLAISIALFFASGLFGKLFYGSTRELNITVNYPAFKEIGNLWTGMGYVESSGFHEETCIYGIQTSSLDMYYPYIFFTTGIIGSALILFCIVYLLFGMLSNMRDIYCRIALSAFIANLVFANFQVNLFTYRYNTAFFMFVIFLYGCGNRSKKRKRGLQPDNYKQSVLV